VSGDDWQAGDLALCLKVGPWARAGLSGPQAGCFYTVRKVDFGPLVILGQGVRLWLEGWPGETGDASFSARRFRKIRPHVPDAEDRETIALLTGKPAKVEA
jgi:hypothetical protein